MQQLFRYRKVLDVEVAHKYYRSWKSPDLEFAPSAECSRTMLRYGLKARWNDKGFSLYAGIREDGKLKTSMEENLCLTFFGRLINPSFENLTELPLERSRSERFLFTNLEVNSQALFGTGSPSLLLNRGSHVTEQDLIASTINGYRLEKEMAGTSSIFTLVSNTSGKSLDQQTLQPENGIFCWQHHLRDFPADVYILKADGIEIKRFYYDPDPALTSAYAILRIFTEVPAENRFILNTNEIEPKEYRIAFLNRSTYWRYKATNRNNHTLTNPAVAVGTDTGLFAHGGDLVFTSVSPMELTEEPVKGIRFLKNASSLSSEILNDLPNADTARIVPERSGGSYTVYSDIFIYL